MAKDLFLEAIAAIYDAALEPRAWPTALSMVGDLMDSTWLVLSAFRTTGEADIVTPDLHCDPEIIELVKAKFNAPETNPSIPVLLASPPGSIHLRERNLTDDEWHRSGLYKEVYRPSGNYHGLGAVVLNSRSHFAPLGVNRPKKRGTYTSRETALLLQILPHFQRALQVSLRLADLQSQRTAHEALWDTLPSGVTLLDCDGRVLWINQAAKAILARGDGLTIRRRSLAAANSRENGALQQLIRAAIATSIGRGVGGGGPLSVSRPSLARPLGVLIAPIRMARQPVARQPVAVVFVTDPERKSEATPDLLKRLYGLTDREAAVAALLLQGMELHEAAQQLRVSMHTARTHLRLIFEKTDTHRQAELVRLLLRGPAGLC